MTEPPAGIFAETMKPERLVSLWRGLFAGAFLAAGFFAQVFLVKRAFFLVLRFFLAASCRTCSLLGNQVHRLRQRLTDPAESNRQGRS